MENKLAKKAQRTENESLLLKKMAARFENLKNKLEKLHSEKTENQEGGDKKKRHTKKAAALVLLCGTMLFASCTMPCSPEIPDNGHHTPSEPAQPSKPDPDKPQETSAALSWLKANIYDVQYQSFSSVDKTQITQKTDSALYNQLTQALDILYSTEEGKSIVKKIPSEKVEIWVTDFNNDPTDATGKFRNEPARFSYASSSGTYVVKLNSNSLKNKEWDPDLLPFLFGRYLLAAEHKEIANNHPISSASREEINRITVQNASLDASGKQLITELQNLEVENTGKSLKSVINNGTYNSSLFGNFYSLKDLISYRDYSDKHGKDTAQKMAFEDYLAYPAGNFQLENPAAANMTDAIYSYLANPSVNYVQSVGKLNNRPSDGQAYSSERIPYVFYEEADDRLNAADEVVKLSSDLFYNASTNTLIYSQRGGNSY